jgi:hypothetical protein
MANELDPNIYKNNGYEFEFPVTRKNAATGKKEPAVGLAGLKGRLRFLPDGADIDPTLVVAVAERSGAPGVYYGKITGGVITAKLFGPPGNAVDGTVVYVVITDDFGEAQGVEKVKAKLVRVIGP